MGLLLGLAVGVRAAPGKVLFQTDFEAAAVDSFPDDFLLSDGGFAVKSVDGNKVLELPGDPLEAFGFYFGPTEKENIAVQARFMGTGKGRRFPTYSVSLGAGGQFKLRVSPAKKSIELYKGDDVVATVPHTWPSGKWQMVYLQVRKVKDGGWNVEGKVWPQGEPEPKDWTITLDQKEQPLGGRPAIWAAPYSGTPILMDDLKVFAIGQ